MTPFQLCDPPRCYRAEGHVGAHNPRPKEAWSFFEQRDQNKIDKAGYATPRGGAKGAYQNHVYRNNRVIVPYERLGSVDLDGYEDGYVIRLLPEQYFSGPGEVRDEFSAADPAVVIGENAFVLYRSHASLQAYPPLETWLVRALTGEAGAPTLRRGPRVADAGHYVLRLSNAGVGRSETNSGPPQGIFAPEYADADTNFLCQALLAWLTVHARQSPYTTTQAHHLKAILEATALLDPGRLDRSGMTRNGLSICPLCLRVIDYSELHDQVDFAGADGLLNAALQIEGATRSTKANLFHIEPLVYERLNHRPTLVSWGHAICNTLLGQRHCYSLSELQGMDLKLGVLVGDEIETIGWISEDFQMIRSPYGAVWVQLSSDMPSAEREASFVDEEGA